MSKYISIDDEVDRYLDKEVKKDEDGKRKEKYSSQFKRLLKIGGK